MVKEGERFVTSKTTLLSLKKSHLTGDQCGEIILSEGSIASATGCSWRVR